MLFLAGKYVQPAKLNAIARQRSPMKKLMKQIMLFLVMMRYTTENRDVMNLTLNELELTPFKVHAAPKHMKAAHGKRKLAQVNNEVSKRLATILNVQQSELESTDNSIEVDSEEDKFML